MINNLKPNIVDNLKTIKCDKCDKDIKLYIKFTVDNINYLMTPNQECIKWFLNKHEDYEMYQFSTSYDFSDNYSDVLTYDIKYPILTTLEFCYVDTNTNCEHVKNNYKDDYVLINIDHEKNIIFEYSFINTSCFPANEIIGREALKNIKIYLFSILNNDKEEIKDNYICPYCGQKVRLYFKYEDNGNISLFKAAEEQLKTFIMFNEHRPLADFNSFNKEYQKLKYGKNIIKYNLEKDDALFKLLNKLSLVFIHHPKCKCSLNDRHGIEYNCIEVYDDIITSVINKAPLDINAIKIEFNDNKNKYINCDLILSADEIKDIVLKLSGDLWTKTKK